MKITKKKKNFTLIGSGDTLISKILNLSLQEVANKFPYIFLNIYRILFT